ncbi:MAG: DUF1573 domain-containing protein [Lentisphaeraceae bacterium]|nr:DUF1573 domain-containing protein [Lentisphaeraceae bacterium]
MKLFLFSLFILNTSILASNEIKWIKASLFYQGKLNEKRTTFVFDVTNNGSTPQTFISGKPSCSCISVINTFPIVIKAGKSAQIKLSFDFKGKNGRNTAKVYLKTLDKTFTLTAEVDIPTAVKISPRFLIWPKNKRNTKSITITLHKDWTGKINRATSVNKKIRCQLTQNKNNITLNVTPDTDMKSDRNFVIINGKDETGKELEYRIYLIIK